MKKIIKGVCLGLISVILVSVIVLGGIMFVYYPKYKSEKRSRDIAPALSGDEMRVMSCNLRCINPGDTGKKSWFYRAGLLLDGIEKAAPGIIGFQEATRWQYKYLTDCLPEYDSTITYRDNAVNSEGCPVFYNVNLYSLIDKGTFWLSETPDKMSRDWGATCYRVCSYAVLETRETGKRFAVFNTHLDHVSELARINGINLVLEKIRQFGSVPAVLMGDLNAQTDSETYAAATAVFDDAALKTENSNPGSCTYQGFGSSLDSGRIDYFMISKTGFEVNACFTVTDTYDGVYPSDHFPLYTDLRLTDK